jgi:hypothetical protein
MKIHNNISSSLAGTASAYSLAYWYFLDSAVPYLSSNVPFPMTGLKWVFQFHA